jgi:membrane protease YdiL (CAAX protease family)
MVSGKSSEGATAGKLAGYWRASTRPITCLVFVAPMLLAYEGGLLFWPQAMRNGADVWLRQLLESFGFSQYLLLPLLTCGILLGWHHLRRDSWTIHGNVLYGMFIESMTLGFFLVVVAQAQSSLLNELTVTPALPAHCALASEGSFVVRLIAFFGAGIYEELLFRLILLSALAAGFCRLGVTRKVSCVTAVALSSLMFAAAHYQLDLNFGTWHIATSFGDTFQWTSFLFRCSAGVFFSLVFLFRGFGIAVGAHALYDIFVSFL